MNYKNTYMSFNFNSKSIFIYRSQFLSSSLDSLLGKDLGKGDFKYLTQEFYIRILDLVKQKGLYPCKNMSVFQKFKEELPSKEKFVDGVLQV